MMHAAPARHHHTALTRCEVDGICVEHARDTLVLVQNLLNIIVVAHCLNRARPPLSKGLCLARQVDTRWWHTVRHTRGEALSQSTRRVGQVVALALKR